MEMSDRKPRSSRQNKVNTQGLYKRAVKEAFLKLDPRIQLRNPVMFLVWIGTIVTALLTINPGLFGPPTDKNPVLFNGLITLILLFTLLFANLAEAVAEGRGKAQADSLRATKSDSMARKLSPDGAVQEISSTQLRKGDLIDRKSVV